LRLFWLHWILANATAVGAVHAMAALVATVEAQHRGQVDLGTVIFLWIATLMLVGYSQQVLLQRWWLDMGFWFAIMPLNFLCGFVGLALGGIFVGILVVIHEAMSPGPPPLVMNLVMNGCLGMCFGVGFGILQTAYLCTTWRQTATWLLASGAGFMLGFGTELVLWESVLEHSRQFSTVGASSLLGTFGGALYGVITGGALIYLLQTRKSPQRADSI